MVFDVNVAMTWLLFLALFPICFFWLRRAWRIVVQRDFSEVALKRGVSPLHPERHAPYAAALNLVAGAILIWVIFGIVTASLAYETWSAVAGSTIWLKIIFDFILSRQAHLQLGRNLAAAPAQDKGDGEGHSAISTATQADVKVDARADAQADNHAGAAADGETGGDKSRNAGS